MGRLDLPDVYRDEDHHIFADDYGSSVDSPLNGAERQGTRSSFGATEGPSQVRTAKLVIPHAGKCVPLLSSRRTRGRES